MTSQNTAHLDSLTEHLRQREEALLDPAVRRGRDQVSALLAADFQEFGASGHIWSRENIFELLANESYTPPAVEDFRCTLLCPSAALVTYRAVSGSAVTLRSSIWTNLSGEWQLRFHQGTPA